MIVLKVGGSVAGIAELGELEDAVVVHGAGTADHGRNGARGADRDLRARPARH